MRKDKDIKTAEEDAIPIWIPPAIGIETLNVYQRWHRVMKSIGRLQKKGQTDSQSEYYASYKYLMEADVKSAVQKALIENRLVMTGTVDSYERGVHIGNKDKRSSKSEITITYTVVNIDNPTEIIEFRGKGVAHDSGDKDIYKAMAGAYKYAMTQSLSIPTGDDPEGDEEQHDNPPSETEEYKQTEKPTQKKEVKNVVRINRMLIELLEWLPLILDPGKHNNLKEFLAPSDGEYTIEKLKDAPAHELHLHVDQTESKIKDIHKKVGDYMKLLDNAGKEEK